ncbi:AEX-3 domain-containing protein [Lipomyces oligophaga]|uniref:AEX-3 domain-containing protein n=1 Tax=Lipomyces oligophaga TaxID=45792 RepID=UPI0034CE23EB
MANESSSAVPLVDFFFISGIDSDALDVFSSAAASIADRRPGSQSPHRSSTPDSVKEVGYSHKRDRSSVDLSIASDTIPENLPYKSPQLPAIPSLSSSVHSNPITRLHPLKTSESPLSTNSSASNSPSVGSINGVGQSRGRQSPLTRSPALRRVPENYKRSPVLTDPLLAGHARKISDYDSVIPDPEPIATSPNQHPLMRKFDPVLLDVYPRPDSPRQDVSTSSTSDVKLPLYVPMFAFPDDIQLVHSDKRPPSSWHHFIMTNQVNEKMYGTCITVWVPVPSHIAVAVEVLNEKWRKANIPTTEREFATSLSMRLKDELANVSDLKNQSNKDESKRSAIKDKIEAANDRIAMLIELLAPIRLGAMTKIKGLSEQSGLWLPRVYGLLSRDSYSCSFRLEWLKALLYGEYALSSSKSDLEAKFSRVPMEYAVAQLIGTSATIHPKIQLKFDIGGISLYARHHAVTEIPGSRDVDLFALFRCLTVETIIELFESLLAERRIVLVSSDLAMLTLSARAILSLIFPLKWQGVCIPVLPARLSACLEMPVPYIIGLHKLIGHSEESISPYANSPSTGLPFLPVEDDCVCCDLDADAVIAVSAPPLLPAPVRSKLRSLLKLSAPLHSSQFAIPIGGSPYTLQTFPGNMFGLTSPDIANPVPQSQYLGKLVRGSSANVFSQPPGKSYPPILDIRALSMAQSEVQSATEEEQGRTILRNRDRALAGVQKQGRRASKVFNSSVNNIKTSIKIRHDHAKSFPSDLSPQNSVPPLIKPRSPQRVHHQPKNRSIASTSLATVIKVVEGHRLTAIDPTETQHCAYCLASGLAEKQMLECIACRMILHTGCAEQEISVACLPASFDANRVRAAFARAMASILLNYRRYFTAEQETGEYKFQEIEFLSKTAKDHAPYARFLLSTQAGTEFIHDVGASIKSRSSISSEDLACLDLFGAIADGVSSRRHRLGHNTTKPADSAFGQTRTDLQPLLEDVKPGHWQTIQIRQPQLAQQGYLAATDALAGEVSGRWPSRLDSDVLRTCLAAYETLSTVGLGIQNGGTVSLL